jgi:hypothetical protein
MANNLLDIIDGTQAQLEGSLEGTRRAVGHPGSRGSASEEDWLRVLKNHLPFRYQADRAFVIDSNGKISEQIDIVVYDRQYSPLLYNHADQKFVPAEAVYAVLEVKQHLDKGHIEYAAGKAASVRRLHRTSVAVPQIGGAKLSGTPQHILAGLLTYESAWTPSFGTPLNDVLAGLVADGQIDIGCALIHGVFEAEYVAGQPPTVTGVPGQRALIQFFMRLLRRLQQRTTASAIDYSAYLAQIP